MHPGSHINALVHTCCIVYDALNRAYMLHCTGCSARAYMLHCTGCSARAYMLHCTGWLVHTCYSIVQDGTCIHAIALYMMAPAYML